MNLNTQPGLMRERLFPRSYQTVPAARAFAQETLTAWDVTGRQADIVLCVSELATNALRHGVPRGRTYRLRLLNFGCCLRVEVQDSGPGRSRILGRPHGNGLRIVEGVSDLWGVLPRSPGKVVWAEFRSGGC
ncbi:ATP-binding protein [Streptomyces sp. WAC07061]|uniref:ATP-binding protein n=1 Tax=Streptomyces sp. WAC07061 TaxID=2487410 RepID=UPI0027BAB4A8|nr:ATP-binding protein [Streptomyces sp. WAC07061]